MKNRNRIVLIAGLSVVSLMLASCESSKPPEAKPVKSEPMTTEDTGTRDVTITPGVAGGVIEESVQVEAKILAVNPATRTLRLVDNDGNRSDFTCGPQVKNLDQLVAGEKVVATMTERLTVYVRDTDEGPNSAYSKAVASAPRGAKPGALIAESYEVVATVTAIDTTTRVASLKFVDGKTRDVNVRKDVDLNRYKVGDDVVIRVTNSIAVVTKKQRP